MSELDRLLGKWELDETAALKITAIASLIVLTAVAWRMMSEDIETQRSTRQFHRDNLVAQKAHLESHANLRKNLVDLARHSKDEAIDLLARLEQQRA